MNLNSFIAFLEKISKFQLELLSKEWVNFIWSSGFPTPIEIPSDYELQVEVDFVELLRDARDLLDQWLHEDMDVDISVHSRESLANRKSWNGLANEINHRALVCLLSAFISQFSQNSQSEETVPLNQRAVEAARLYFMLISVDGSHIFQVFQGVIYHQCLEIFKSLASFNRQPKAVVRGRGRKRNIVDDDDDYIERETENGYCPTPFNNRDVVIKLCCRVIDDLHYSLTKFSLQTDEGSLNQTIQSMVQVAGVEKRETNFLIRPPHRNTTVYLAFKAYSILEILCTPFHGIVSDTLKDVMRSIFPCLCIYEQQSWQQLSQDTIVVKDHSVNFIIHIIKKLKQESYNSVSTIIEQICVKVPDKADVRSKYIDIIIDIINRFPSDLFRRTVLFLCSLCLSDAVKHRLLGVELVAKIASLVPKLNANDSISSLDSRRSSADGRRSSILENNHTNKSHVTNRFLFGLVVARCADVSPRIRIKSLSILSNLLRSQDFFMYEVVEEIFVIQVREENHEMFDFNKFYSDKLYEETSIPDPLPTSGTVMTLIERLTHDARALVRKNALHVISDICMVHNKWITEQRLNILVSAYKDLSVGNRKVMAQCLTDLLESKPENALLINAWVAGVVPLFAENEVKSQEKVLELASSIILDKIVPLNKMSTDKDKLPWKIIALISQRDMRKLFRYACQQWCLKNYIKDQFIKCLQTYIGSENNLAAWYFLVCISEYQDLPNPEAILNYFYEKVYNQSGVDMLESELVMQTLTLSWRKLKPAQITELCARLKTSFEQFEVPLPLVSNSLEIIQLNDRDAIKEWVEPILMECKERTKQRVKTVIEKECYSDTLLCRLIFMMGELSLVCPDVVEIESVTALSNLIDIANIDESSLETSLSQFGYVHTVTVITLGKLSLQNQFTAKVIVPILGALVSAKTPSGIKNNANIALTDLCIRFSSLVEPYFADMFICLKDPDAAVRRNTLRLVTMLIQEQYLKLKAHIFIYLLSMLLDPSSEIRDFTSSFIVNSLMTKDASIVFTHFVQGIFFLNGYEGASRDQISSQERSVFCLMGEENKMARRELYMFLLQNMDDVMKFKTKYRICVEILNTIAEDKIRLKGPKGELEKGVIILKDSLYILGCDEIKMTVRKSCKDGGPDDEDDDVADAVAVAKKNVMSQLYSSLTKKNLVDNIIPIFKKLKQKLDSEKSPLVGDVINCLREILKEFSKEQVEEILAADPSLSAEVLHALRRQESEEGTSNQSQEEVGLSSPQDAVMEQMVQVAKRISCRVMLHGPESISTDDTQVDEEGVEQFVPSGSMSSNAVNADSTPLRGGRVRTPSRSSQSPLVNDVSSSSRGLNGVSPPINNDLDRKKIRVKRSGRSDRSSSVMSDMSDCSTSLSSLSSHTSSSSSSSKSRRRKR